MIHQYKYTQVDTSKSQTSIEKLLSKYGVTETRFTNRADMIMLEFNYPDQKDGKPYTLGVRIKIPLPEGRDRDQIRRQSYRVLYHHLKAKFIYIESGMAEFGQEFLGSLIYSLPGGKSATVGEIIGPQMEKHIIEKKSEILMLPEST